MQHLGIRLRFTPITLHRRHNATMKHRWQSFLTDDSDTEFQNVLRQRKAQSEQAEVRRSSVQETRRHLNRTSQHRQTSNYLCPGQEQAPEDSLRYLVVEGLRRMQQRLNPVLQTGEGEIFIG